MNAHYFLSIRDRQKAAETEEAPAEAAGHVTPHPSDVLDMPVDPNEPTYCLCHQVSYGEMIGCDNPEVSTAPAHPCIRFRCRPFWHRPELIFISIFSAPSNGSISRAWASSPSPRASGSVPNVPRTERRNRRPVCFVFRTRGGEVDKKIPQNTKLQIYYLFLYLYLLLSFSMK